MQDNPILKRLTRGNQWYDHANVKRVMAITALVGIGIALGAMLADPMRDTALGNVPIGLIAVGVVIALANPLIVFAITALLTMQETQREDFQQLRLAGINPQDIADAYLQAAQYRLRYLWALSLGGAPSILLAITHLLVATGFSLSCVAKVGCTPASLVEPVMFGLIASMVIVAAMIGVTLPLYGVALLAGAWIGVRWPRHTVLITGGVLTVGVGLAISVGSLVYASPEWLWIWMCAAPFGIPIAGRLIMSILGTELDEAIIMRGTVLESR